MKTEFDAKRVTVFVGETDRWHSRPLYEAIVTMLHAEGIAGAMVLQGTLAKRIHPFARYTPRQRERAADAVRRVGLGGYEQRGIGQLSGGQLQRVVIARTLASSADVVALADYFKKIADATSDRPSVKYEEIE